MISLPGKISKQYLRGAALLMVYAFQMVCFQALMGAKAPGGDENDFRPLFIHTHTSPITHPHSYSHPAVSYYTQLVKQGITGLRSCCPVMAHTDFTDLFILNSNFILEQHLQVIPQIIADVSEGHFKLFRIFRVFLL